MDYLIGKSGNTIILKFDAPEENLCFRIPKGLPDTSTSKGNLAIKIDCNRFKEIEILEEGECEVWFWFENVKRFLLKGAGEEKLYTMRFWKDVRWFIMSGDGNVEVSAGGIPVVCEKGIHYAYIIKPSGRENYAFPKGLIERGETPEEAALREVEEETGLEVKVGPLIEHINYYYKHPTKGVKIYKEVLYYLLFVEGKKKEHDWEVAEVKKVPVSELIEVLSYTSEKKSARKLLELIKSGKINLC